jgi:N-acyl-L-homoserine lactone synthetase
MIIVIDGINAGRFSGLLEQVHALRARVFHDRLGWDVTVTNGKEIDLFDSLDPTHIVSINDAGQVVGAMRLLQTMGPNMLADVFNAILDGEAAPRSPLIWEATRFCVDTNILTERKTRNSISYVTSEVMVGAFEYARAAGVQDAVAVIDPVMNRVLKRSANAPYDYLGSPTPMGKVTAMAALMDCSDARIKAVRDFAGIKGEIFMKDETALECYGDADQTAASADVSHQPSALDCYLAEQVSSAKTSSDLRAAMTIISEVYADTPLVRET